MVMVAVVRVVSSVMLDLVFVVGFFVIFFFVVVVFVSVAVVVS